MQIISGAGFTAKEVATFTEIIHHNILESIQVRRETDTETEKGGAGKGGEGQ